MKTPILLPLLTALMAARLTSANIWNEAGDAGDSLWNAQQTVGIGALTQINGALPSDAELDMFAIKITDAPNFLAWRNGAAMSDPDLWLFDASGYGITYNDSVSNGQTTLTGANVPGNGLYYLGISNGGAAAASAGGNIWLTSLFIGERAPDGPGATSPFTGWSSLGLNNSTLTYSIFLQGAEFSVVPEPSIAALSALGALLLRHAARRKRG